MAALRDEGEQGPHRHQQQRRHQRFRDHLPAAEQAGAEDDLDLRGREQGLREDGAGGGDRGRAQPAGHLRRAHARGRRRRPRLLHADRLRHADRGGQGGPLVRRAPARDGDGAARGLRVHQGLEGRPAGQPRVPQDDAELRAHDGHGRAHDHRRGGGDRARGGARSRRHHHPRHLRAAALPGEGLREAHREAHRPRRGRRGGRSQARADRPPRGEGDEGRVLRQPRHRHAHPRLELHPERDLDRAALRERDARGRARTRSRARKTRTSSTRARRR